MLEEGYTNLYALDISSLALERAKARLGNKARQVKWTVADVIEFAPEVKFDFWHDRAAFHFLTKESDINKYVKSVSNYVKGYLSIGTFSDSGPLKCSGLAMKQYTQEALMSRFQGEFEKINCFREQHTTPAQSVQDFIFCIFKRKLS